MLHIMHTSVCFSVVYVDCIIQCTVKNLSNYLLSVVQISISHALLSALDCFLEYKKTRMYINTWIQGSSAYFSVYMHYTHTAFQCSVVSECQVFPVSVV